MNTKYLISIAVNNKETKHPELVTVTKTLPESDFPVETFRDVIDTLVRSFPKGIRFGSTYRVEIKALYSNDKMETLAFIKGNYVGLDMIKFERIFLDMDKFGIDNEDFDDTKWGIVETANMFSIRAGIYVDCIDNIRKEVNQALFEHQGVF